MSTELVLLVGDLFIPLRVPDVDVQFKSILVPNKIQHVICLGNIGCQDTFDWLHGLSSDFHVVQGDYDINRNLPEKQAIQVGNFRIGAIHGHQIIPLGDLEILANIQRELDCDILVSGYTHQLSINTKENKLYLNPGSLSGALSPLMEECAPSFILMALQGEEATIYTYVLNDKNKKFEVGQMEYFRGSNELKIIKEIGGDNDNDDDKSENSENSENSKSSKSSKKENENENNENNIINNEKKEETEKEKEEEKEKEKEKENENEKEEEKEDKKEEVNILEKEENVEQKELTQDNNPSSLEQNQPEEVKEADNKDEKMDE